MLPNPELTNSGLRRRNLCMRLNRTATSGSYVPSTFADPANSFYEKAALRRAAENTRYFATVNFASVGSPTTTGVVRLVVRRFFLRPHSTEAPSLHRSYPEAVKLGGNEGGRQYVRHVGRPIEPFPDSANPNGRSRS
jgi:hypothetical protein